MCVALRSPQMLQLKRIPILQQKFAQAIYYSLIKGCFNQTRFQWLPPAGYPPTASTAGAGAGPSGRGMVPQVGKGGAGGGLECMPGARGVAHPG